jgi:uncharacterized protein
MRVLAIDGGGIRGLIPALVLADLEARTRRPISASFDLIAGTSTGGILACALARASDAGDGPHFSASALVQLYVDEGPKIFSADLLRRIRTVDGFIDERYSDAGLRAALDKYLGDARISEALTDVFVTAYELEERFAFFFRSSRARVKASDDFTMADAAHATSAAPTYFEPARVRDVGEVKTYTLVDGGVFATNPAMCALAEVSRAGKLGEVDLLLSLGTGSQSEPIRYEDARGWGQLEWAPRIVDVVFDGLSETVDFQASQLLDDKYVRLQTGLAGADEGLDDASAKNLAALRRIGERLVADRAADLDRVAKILTS